MKRSLLLAYQWITGFSDAGTGALLCVAPVFTLRLMGLHAPQDAVPYIAYIGAFVLSVGLACLYGGYLLLVRACAARLETLWLLVGFSRAAVAIYVLKAILVRELEPGWATVALFDGACALVQGIGLSRKWLADAA